MAERPKIVPIAAARIDQDLVEVVEALLGQVKRGEVIGLHYVAETGAEPEFFTASDCPYRGRGMIDALKDYAVSEGGE